MKFTMPVDKIVPTNKGHTIEFVKGVPTHVPKECWRDVQAAGAVPEDQEAAQAKPSAKVAVVDDPVERRERIFAGFTAMVEANRRGDFGASGAPSQAALEKVVGFEVDSKERDELWTEFQQLSPEKEAEAAALKEAAAKAAADAAADKVAADAAASAAAAATAKKPPKARARA
jgi:hypothetical protein